MTAPLIVPMAEGVNVTLKVHLPCGATAFPQGVAPPGAAEYSPLAAMLVRFRTMFWLLVNVTVFGELVVPTACATNVKLVAENVTGSAAAPESP